MSSKHAILYAEDDLDDLFLVQQAFTKHDAINIIHASNGKQALTKLEEMAQTHSLPCLVILDVNMPIMNGRDALQAIRNNPLLSKLTVVLFTTSNSPADLAFAKSHNAAFITKPVDYKDVESIANRFMEQCDFSVNKV